MLFLESYYQLVPDIFNKNFYNNTLEIALLPFSMMLIIIFFHQSFQKNNQRHEINI